MHPPAPFAQDALEFLELLAVSHRAPIVCLAAVRECLSRSACQLLGQAHNHGGVQWGRPRAPVRSVWRTAQTADGGVRGSEDGLFGKKERTLREAGTGRGSSRRSACKGGRFAAEDRILDVAIALERMYELSGGEITYKMRTRASWFLGRDAEDRLRVMKSVASFYGVRSAIVHNRKNKPSAERCREAFDTGFEIAARTLFELLKDGPPGDWESLVIAGR